MIKRIGLSLGVIAGTFFSASPFYKLDKSYYVSSFLNVEYMRHYYRYDTPSLYQKIKNGKELYFLGHYFNALDENVTPFGVVYGNPDAPLFIWAPFQSTIDSKLADQNKDLFLKGVSSEFTGEIYGVFHFKFKMPPVIFDNLSDFNALSRGVYSGIYDFNNLPDRIKENHKNTKDFLRLLFENPNKNIQSIQFKNNISSDYEITTNSEGEVVLSNAEYKDISLKGSLINYFEKNNPDYVGLQELKDSEILKVYGLLNSTDESKKYIVGLAEDKDGKKFNFTTDSLNINDLFGL